ncbi:MAG: hypothetical protein U0518_01645 [Candidatus Gracilibacteria bacterium]
MEINQNEPHSATSIGNNAAVLQNSAQVVCTDMHQTVSHIIQNNSHERSLTPQRILKITEEALNRQISMLGVSEHEKQLIKTNLIPVAGNIIKYLKNNEGEILDDPSVFGYVYTQDITESTTKSAYLEGLYSPSKTHIGIYLGRIPNENELINTLNHEINHWYFRYITTLRSSYTQKSLLQIGGSSAYKIILECFGHLTGAEATIVKGSYTHDDGIRRAGGGSNGDIMDQYTLGSLLAQKLLAAQILLGKQSRKTDFIDFCNTYRDQLMNCVYTPERLTSLFHLLHITNPDYKVDNNTLLSLLNWVEQGR